MVTVAKPLSGLVFLCGQCPVLPDGTVVEGSVAEKTRVVCENAKNALELAGTSLDKVIKVQVSSLTMFIKETFVLITAYIDVLHGYSRL